MESWWTISWWAPSRWRSMTSSAPRPRPSTLSSIPVWFTFGFRVIFRTIMPFLLYTVLLLVNFKVVFFPLWARTTTRSTTVWAVWGGMASFVSWRPAFGWTTTTTLSARARWARTTWRGTSSFRPKQTFVDFLPYLLLKINSPWSTATSWPWLLFRRFFLWCWLRWYWWWWWWCLFRFCLLLLLFSWFRISQF